MSNRLIMVLILLAILSIPIFIILYKFIWTPLHYQRQFRQQGVGGPDYNPVSGNTAELQRLMVKEGGNQQPKIDSFCHDKVVKMVMPHFHVWSKVYGEPFLYWFGAKPRLAVSDPDMIKEILLNTSGLFGKTRVNPLVKALFGEGIVYLEGEQWAVHRKITSQAFNRERVKELIPEIVDSTKTILQKWVAKIGDGEKLELDVYKEFNDLSADVISRTAFGSNFEEGKRIFELQDQLVKVAAEAIRSVYFPGFKYLPTKKNRMIWELKKGTRELIIKMIEKNTQTRENPKALISLLMSPYKAKGKVEKRLTLDEIIDECKTFYFAGKESTANLLTWAFLLLALHQEWQNKAREEVLWVCGRTELPSADHLNNLKIVTMILNEALRLYPAAAISMREANRNVKLGNLHVPANTQLFLAMTAVHHDPEIWGEDAKEFNPMRFVESRKHLAAYFPFGLGPRICVGQNLAMVEAKIVVAMIIREFHFEVSPSYIHAPMQSLTVQPQFGAPIIIRRSLS